MYLFFSMCFELLLQFLACLIYCYLTYQNIEVFVLIRTFSWFFASFLTGSAADLSWKTLIRSQVKQLFFQKLITENYFYRIMHFK